MINITTVPLLSQLLKPVCENCAARLIRIALVLICHAQHKAQLQPLKPLMVFQPSPSDHLTALFLLKHPHAISVKTIHIFYILLRVGDLLLRVRKQRFHERGDARIAVQFIQLRYVFHGNLPNPHSGRLGNLPWKIMKTPVNPVKILRINITQPFYAISAARKARILIPVI